MNTLMRGVLVLVLILSTFTGRPQIQSGHAANLLHRDGVSVIAVTQATGNVIDEKFTTGFGEKTDINNSNIRTFRKYPGVYPNLARLIVDHAPYETVEAVLEIPNLTAQQRDLLQHYLDEFIVTDTEPALVEGGDRYNPGIYQ